MGIFNKFFGGNPQNKKNFTIDISKNGISINNNIFDLPFNVLDLKKILGEPQRFRKSEPNKDISENTIYTWDKIGLFVFAKNEIDVNEVNIQLSDAKEYDFSPNHQYQEILTINGLNYKDAIKVSKKAYNGEMVLSDIKLNYELDYDSKQILEICIYKSEPIKEVVSNKYNLKVISGDKIEFRDFNFKLAIIEELMFNQKLITPIFDVYEFSKIKNIDEFNESNGGYEPLKEVVEYFKALEIDINLAKKVTEIYQDGGNEIYMNIAPQWDGEDDIFDIKTFEDVKHFPNLKKMTLLFTNENIIKELKAKGIDAQVL